MLTYIGISDDRPCSCCDGDGHVLASLLLVIREAKKRKQRGEIKKRAANHVVSVRLPDVAREGRKKSKIDCLLLSTLSAKLMDLDCEVRCTTNASKGGFSRFSFLLGERDLRSDRL